MKLIAGSNLTQYQARQVLAAFPYRHYAIGPGQYYQNERAWLVDHAFWFKKNGQLAARRYAEPAWMVKYENK